MKAHTVRSFDEALRTVGEDVLRMGRLSRGQVSAARKLLEDAQARSAAAIEAADDGIDELDRKISDEVQRFLALRQPMGIDLRTLISCDRIATDLERVADHATSIARRMGRIAEEDVELDLTRLAALSGKVLDQLDRVIEAIERRDVEVARAIWDADREIDQLYEEAFSAQLQEMCRDTSRIGSHAHALFIAKSLERIGDHVTNIAEDLVFWVTGERLRRRDSRNAR